LDAVDIISLSVIFLTSFVLPGIQSEVAVS
jgi:hypothetical protein